MLALKIVKSMQVMLPALKIKGVTYKVTSIASKAFYKNKKIETVKIGKNITKIGTMAFYNAKKLKTVQFMGTKLKTVGKKAFIGIDKKATINVSKSKAS